MTLARLLGVSLVQVLTPVVLPGSVQAMRELWGMKLTTRATFAKFVIAPVLFITLVVFLVIVHNIIHAL